MPTLSQQCCLYQPCGSSVSIKLVCDCGLAIEHCQHQLCHISIKPVCDCRLAIEHCQHQLCHISIKLVCDCGLAIEHCQHQLCHISIKLVCDCGLAIEHCQHQLCHISISYVRTSTSSLSVIVDLPLNIVSISYVTSASVMFGHQHQACL